jgi:hypothetical protein
VTDRISPARDQPERPRLVLALFVGLTFLVLPIPKCTVPFSSGIYFGNSLVWSCVVCLHVAATRRREAMCLMWVLTVPVQVVRSKKGWN